MSYFLCFVFFFKQKTAYEMRISDWSSDVCSSDLLPDVGRVEAYLPACAQSRAAEHLPGDPSRAGGSARGVAPGLCALRARQRSLTETDRAGAHPEEHHDPDRDDPRPRTGLADRLFRGHRNHLRVARSEEHTSELQSLMRISYAVFCLKKKKYENKIS